MAGQGEKRSADGSAPAFNTMESLVAIAVIAGLSLVLGCVALVMPTQSVDEQSVEYTQSGTFAYSADTPRNSPYGANGLTAGEPILIDVVGPVVTGFEYKLTGRDAADLRGSASMTASVVLPEGLSRDFTVAEEKTFTGDEVELAGTLPLTEISRYIENARSSFGDIGVASSAVVTLKPTIQSNGSLGDRPLEAKFAPELSFSLSGDTLTVNPGTDAGASVREVLKPTEPGKVEFEAEVANTVPLLVVNPSVSLARYLGFGLAALCLLLGWWRARPLWAAGQSAEPTRIRSLYGSRIVAVQSLALPDGPIADVADMSSLAELAKRYESMILHVEDVGVDSYLVWDNGMLYRYQARADDLPEAERASVSRDGPHESRNSSMQTGHKANGVERGEKVLPVQAARR